MSGYQDETPSQRTAREAREAREAEAARVKAAPTPPAQPAPPAQPTQKDKDQWEAEMARTKAQTPAGPTAADISNAEKNRKIVEAQDNPYNQFLKDREREGQMALARAANLVKKRKREAENRLREENEQAG